MKPVAIRIVKDEITGEIVAYVEESGAKPRSGIAVRPGKCWTWDEGSHLRLFGVINEAGWNAIDSPAAKNQGKK